VCLPSAKKIPEETLRWENYFAVGISQVITEGELVNHSLGTFTKLRKATISYVMSVCLCVCLHGTTRFPLNVFSWALILEYFSKICRENSGFIKMWQEWQVLYMKTYGHLWHHPGHLLLESEIFQKKLQRKLNHIFHVQ
jgi:hypothetical protein